MMIFGLFVDPECPMLNLLQSLESPPEKLNGLFSMVYGPPPLISNLFFQLFSQFYQQIYEKLENL